VNRSNSDSLISLQRILTVIKRLSIGMKLLHQEIPILDTYAPKSRTTKEKNSELQRDYFTTIIKD
jgi:hypothetical protein